MKEIAKALVRACFFILASPLLLIYFIVAICIKSDTHFQAWSELISLLPGKFGAYFRYAFFRFTMKTIGVNSYVGFGVLFSHADTELGEGVYLGPGCNIGKCKIGSDCLFGSAVHVLSGTKQHSFKSLDVPVREQGGEFVSISIGEDCWVGNGALIMADVGAKCVIGAGSVVTKPIPDYSIVAGNPAKVIGSRL